jgi:formylmethanofuran dehydrogenase subunit E
LEKDMTQSLSVLLKRSSARHDHLCPRQVLGVRMGLAGLAAIGLPAPMPHKAALIILETDGCFADGIEVASGATVGHRTLRVMDFGKIAATFADIKSGVCVRLAPRIDVRARALAYAPEERKSYDAQLKGYAIMPQEELFTFQEVTLDPALEGLVSQAGIRTRCEACGEEIINEREVVVKDRVLCRNCAGRRYYHKHIDHPGMLRMASQAAESGLAGPKG